MKLLKKVFFYLFFTFLTLVIAGAISVYLYQDKIVNQLIREANKHLLTPVHAEKIEATIWKNFPSVSVAMYGVFVEENSSRHGMLASADQIIISFSVLDLVQGDYVIKEIQAKNGQVNLVIDNQGNPNYLIVKPVEKSQGGMVLDLKKILINNMNLTLDNKAKNSEYDLDLHSVNASLQVLDNYVITDLRGSIGSKFLRFNNDKFIQDQEWDIESALNYNTESKLLSIEKAELVNAIGEYDLKGSYDFSSDYTEIDFEAKRSTIGAIINFLPLSSQTKLSEYKSDGDIYLTGKLQGNVTSTQSPSVKINFGTEGATIYHPKYKTKLTGVQLQGEFNSDNISDASKASLKLTDIACQMEDKPIKGNLSITNFNDPWIETSLTGAMDMNSLMSFYPSENIRDAKGIVNFNLDFTGKLSYLKSKNTVDRVEINGDISLSDVSLKWKKAKLPFKGLNGTMLFNNNDLALNDVTGTFGESDFQLNGFFKDIISYLLLDQKKFGIEADLKSDFIDLDELLASNEDSKKENYLFRIPKDLFLTFNCDIGRIKFRRLDARKVTGKLKVKDQLAVGKDIKADAMGGQLVINGVINAREENHIMVNADGNLNRIDIDSIFYVFENFDQDWLIDKNLKGQIFSDVITEMAFQKDLTFLSKEFIADIGISIKNGELLNFEPMQKLSKFVDGQDLSNLRFSDLKNDIHIQDRTIYLPQMEVSTNITTIALSGTHTFDQHIDYRAVVPLIINPKMDKDEYYGAVEDDGSGKSKLFLRITGTTDDYKVSYDTDAVKKKIIADLKKEVNELKAAFKNKGKKRKEVLGLNEDEYFDWDHNHKN